MSSQYTDTEATQLGSGFIIAVILVAVVLLVGLVGFFFVGVRVVPTQPGMQPPVPAGGAPAEPVLPGLTGSESVEDLQAIRDQLRAEKEALEAELEKAREDPAEEEAPTTRPR